MGLRQKEKLRHKWTVEELSRKLACLAEDSSIRLVVLFGSLTGKQSDQAHDIDLGLLADEAINLLEMTNRVSRLLHEDAVDLVDLRSCSPVLKASVAQSGIALYEREDGDFVRFVSWAWKVHIDTQPLRQIQRNSLKNYLKKTDDS